MLSRLLDFGWLAGAVNNCQKIKAIMASKRKYPALKEGSHAQKPSRKRYVFQFHQMYPANTRLPKQRALWEKGNKKTVGLVGLFKFFESILTAEMHFFRTSTARGARAFSQGEITQLY